MKLGALILSSFISSAIAAPAIVWKQNDSSSSVVHRSEPIIVNELVDSFKDDSSSSDGVSAVIFLVGRDNNGNEALSGLTKSGSLPNISSKYNDAHTIHHHVWGIDGTNKVVKTARDDVRKTRVLDLSLNEFNNKLSTFENNNNNNNNKKDVEITEDGAVREEQQQGDRVLANSDIVIVQVSPNTDSNVIDNVISRAIDHDMLKSVVLTAVRGTTEVKQEINMMNRRKLMDQSTSSKSSRSAAAAASGRRRLEQEDEQEEDVDGENNNNNNDKTGVYYVHMTPNIFAGILYMFFFIFIAITGISCMGQISNSDVYVSKMPSVGREA